MRILAIRGRNLASLAGDFAIDFSCEPLLSAGLFAICGPTGAGKSTLLDALCLALYDNTPRLKAASQGAELPDVGTETLSQRDARNVLRRGATEGYAEVDFVGNDGVEYRARWAVRRARSRSDGRLQASEMSLVRIADQHPLGGVNKTEVLPAIAQRTGLSFEQFTRAVLLAQNEFFAFLKARDDERASLLETLTGTDEFRNISMRAHERNRQEQSALEELQHRLGEQQPLEDEARRQLDEEGARAAAALADAQQRQEAIQVLLNWQRQYAQALDAQARSRTGLDAARAAHEEASPQRRMLSLVEAVQPAAALLQACQRLDGERALADAALEQARTDHGAAQTHLATKGQVREQAAREKAQTEAAFEQFAPVLEEVRRLDVELQARLPGHEAAVKAVADGERALQERRSETDALKAAQHGEAAQLSQLQQWLLAREPLLALTREWPRWDLLYGQAGNMHRAVEQAAELVRRKAQALQQAEARAAQAASATAAAQDLLAQREKALAAAQHARAAFDGQGMAKRKAALEVRREALRTGADLWRRVSESRARRQEMSAAVEQSAQRMQSFGRELEALATLLPQLRAAAQQAQRSWRLAEAASGDTAHALRANLQSGEPCPICGSTEHPGVGDEHPMVSALENEWKARQDELAQSEADKKTGTALLEVARREHNVARQGLDAHLPALQALEAQWGADPAARESVPEADRIGWFDAGLDAVKQQLAQLAEHEEQLRLAQRMCDEQNEAVQAAREQLQRLRDAAREAGFACQTAEREHRASQADHDKAATALEQLLAQLEPAASAAAGADWRAAWACDPDAFRYARQREARACLDTEAQAADLRTRLTAREHELQAASHAQLGAQDQLVTSRRTLDDARKELEERRQRRGALLADTPYAGQSVTNIEGQWRVALQRVRQAHEYAAAAAAAAETQAAALGGVLQQAELHARGLAQQAAGAASQLSSWIQRFNDEAASQGGSTQVLELPQLVELLGHDAQWLAEQRAAIRALDDRLQAADTVWQERCRQCEELHARRPVVVGVDDAEAAHRSATEQAQAAQHSVSEIELRLRQDNERRQRSGELRERITTQEECARLWSRLNDLIGSADGKKFRNHAQQMTLDVLLGYANHHLQQLARRYCLQRLPNGLALAVVDCDMGGELRSVHSLSGGESFLVSLALALGLASLSSHRVRVESLFIDEGFGSLDADTLAVAMDALDRLQSQGRKVGVISHVQEMTERIPARIRLRRGVGGTSRMEVQG